MNLIYHKTEDKVITCAMKINETKFIYHITEDSSYNMCSENSHLRVLNAKNHFNLF